MDEGAGASGAAGAAGGAGALDWDGEHGAFWVREQEHQDAVLRPFVAPLLDAAGVDAGTAVLDVGCGCGATTRAAAERGAAPVMGLDLSSAMLARARELATAQGAGGVDFVQGDAQTHPFAPATFDAVISRFGVMFFDDPHAAFRGFARALRPGGTLAFVCWQSARRNPHISLPMRAIVAAFPEALPRDTPQPPFSMAEPDDVRELLEGTGFGDVGFEPIEQELRVGDDPDQVLAHYLSGPMARLLLEPQPAAEVEAVAKRIRGQLAEHAGSDGVHLGSAAWLVTARAR
ncbi:class I SAM-dependent methyltransferase [Tomitella fengzijianii]|uniref:Class I SAM-dependent methyltransferase n=1 Tax=Tomitella fengzijianii TaxID=2597660 RepID=A0A516X0F9_9ACTN|nr:class I SAM-dependent methyltransferase [Tomitella fengzijianii]QDQ96569.1 class I SAM-dependent methyltransferase [Tomitella fengzijianii]